MEAKKNYIVIKTESLRKMFLEFSEQGNKSSAIHQYLDGIIKLSHMMKSLVAADRNGDWQSPIQAVLDLLPIFRECDINYLRYGSFYLEKVKMIRLEYPSVCEQFMLRKFVVQTEHGGFKANSPDMRLEQSTQMSKKSTGGIIGQTKQKAYITEWELIYHGRQPISNCFTELMQPEISNMIQGHHELYGKSAQNFNESVDKVTSFLSSRGNPYSFAIPSQLHNCTSGQLVSSEIAERYCNLQGKQLSTIPPCKVSL